MITAEIKALIEQFGVGAVATISPDGRPMVSPKGTFVVWDETELVFANIRSPQTIRNLEENPDVEVCFTDVFQRIGCRVRGRATYLRKGTAQFEAYHPLFAEKWPSLEHLIRGYVSIVVENAARLKSPVYDIGMTATDLQASWLETYSQLIAGRAGQG